MIKRLPEDLVNQIAAGEVVERPSHLVKELVENSIDAGATEIEIHISQGGRSIEIHDNGKGIARDQLSMALDRHTTSKIQNIEDLWRIGSFGFRGEALASAASVSRMRILSRATGSDEAAEILTEFGVKQAPRKSSREVGTTLSVEELFQNVPARLKFLKSATAETSQIKSALKALALAHPHITFTVKVDGSLVFYWPQVNNVCDRVKAVVEVDEVFETSAEIAGFQARVFACSPNVTFSQNKKIWTFVKNRWVQDRGLQTAVIEAYRSLLMHGEYPIAVVYLECPSEEIDVNIHPTKSQVKFRDSSLPFRVVHRATRNLLEKAPWLHRLLGSPSPQETKSVDNFEPKAFNTPQPANYSFEAHDFSRTQFKTQSAHDARSIESTSSLSWSSLHLIGQAHLTYIVAQSAKSLIFIDQHAAHERVLFERIQKSLRDKSIEVQNYLIPFVVDVDEAHSEALAASLNLLEEKMGLSVDQAGPTSFAVRAAPALLKEEGLLPVLQHLARDLAEQGESYAFEKKLNDRFATMACHSAIRAGRSLAPEEMKELLVQMEEFPLSSFCPHGRPVYVEYPITQLERDFGRIN